jgi:hypothetical protein
VLPNLLRKTAYFNFAKAYHHSAISTATVKEQTGEIITYLRTDCDLILYPVNCIKLSKRYSHQARKDAIADTIAGSLTRTTDSATLSDSMLTMGRKCPKKTVHFFTAFCEKDFGVCHWIKFVLVTRWRISVLLAHIVLLVEYISSKTNNTYSTITITT